MSATASCADDIRAAIAAAGGAIRFDEYMSLSLYGPGGFYTAAGGRAGRRGDFITSPEVGPLFGAVLSRWLDATWDELGRPATFTVVEAGAGTGTLARSILAAAPRCIDAMRYVTVELSAAQRAAHPAGVEARTELPADRFTGVIIANELLDNLPFRLLVADGGWRESWVGVDGERFVELLRPFDGAPPVALPARPDLGARVPILDVAREWLATATGLLATGRVLVFDYGTATTAELAARPWRDWLRTYSSHARGAHYLRDAGAQDITTDVPIDQITAQDLGAEVAVRTQRQFLQRWGIDELVEEGREVWARDAARPSLAAMAMRSRVREAEALLDPDGLGGFHAVEWQKHA